MDPITSVKRKTLIIIRNPVIQALPETTIFWDSPKFIVLLQILVYFNLNIIISRDFHLTIIFSIFFGHVHNKIICAIF